MQVDLIDLERGTLGEDETGEVGDLVDADDLLINFSFLGCLLDRPAHHFLGWFSFPEHGLGIFIDNLNNLCFRNGPRWGSPYGNRGWFLLDRSRLSFCSRGSTACQHLPEGFTHVPATEIRDLPGRFLLNRFGLVIGVRKEIVQSIRRGYRGAGVFRCGSRSLNGLRFVRHTQFLHQCREIPGI